jgi:ketosteroid isomerase-like protein
LYGKARVARDTATAVSEANVQIVRKLLSAFARRDHEQVFDFYDSDIEWDASQIAEVIPDLAGVYRGHQGVRTYWRRWLSAWSDLRFEVEDVRDAGNDVVALICNQHQTGRHSGIETPFPPYALVFTFRDGKVVRWKSYVDQDSALKAVGLIK